VAADRRGRIDSGTGASRQVQRRAVGPLLGQKREQAGRLTAAHARGVYGFSNRLSPISYSIQI
jgi:hypothetical protein